VGTRAGLDTVSKRKIPSLRRESNPDYLIVQPEASRYNDSTTQLCVRSSFWNSSDTEILWDDVPSAAGRHGCSPQALSPTYSLHGEQSFRNSQSHTWSRNPTPSMGSEYSLSCSQNSVFYITIIYDTKIFINMYTIYAPISCILVYAHIRVF